MEPEPSNASLIVTHEEDQYGILGRKPPINAVSVGLIYHQERIYKFLTQSKPNNVPFRVVAKDFDLLHYTMDFVPGRINAHTVNGTITAYSIEA